MKCPACGCEDLRVIDSRPSDGNTIRRRRECESCKARYTTFETIEFNQLVVVKKDGSKELFDKTKMLSGLLKSCHKRPVDAEKLADEIETDLMNAMQREVTTAQIGEAVMKKLKAADEVAYVRFASVYKEFKDIEVFMEELMKTLKERSGANN